MCSIITEYTVSSKHAVNSARSDALQSIGAEVVVGDLTRVGTGPAVFANFNKVVRGHTYRDGDSLNRALAAFNYRACTARLAHEPTQLPQWICSRFGHKQRIRRN